jgi:Tfp pilus assembly protein PilV
MVKKTNYGQSLIEVVFSVGIIVMVLTAVVSLVVSSLHSRTNNYDRKRAAELGQKVIENLVAEKQSDPTNFFNPASDVFWAGLNLGNTQTMDGYDGYYYAIDYAPTAGGCTTVCANVTVAVGYSGEADDTNVIFTRFFSK